MEGSNQHPAAPIPRAYVNFAAGEGGALELAVSLGYKQGDADAMLVAPIVMSWEFVPILIKLLQSQLDAYQEQIGHVRTLDPEQAKQR